MVMRDFQAIFDALPTTMHVRCTWCGLVGRDGCGHLVEGTAPIAITGFVGPGGLMLCRPVPVQVPIHPQTGLYLKGRTQYEQ